MKRYVRCKIDVLAIDIDKINLFAKSGFELFDIYGNEAVFSYTIPEETDSFINICKKFYNLDIQSLHYEKVEMVGLTLKEIKIDNFAKVERFMYWFDDAGTMLNYLYREEGEVGAVVADTLLATAKVFGIKLQDVFYYRDSLEV